MVENHLTDRGLKVYQQATGQVDTLISAVLADLAAGDRDRLGALLAGLVAALGGRSEAAAAPGSRRR